MKMNDPLGNTIVYRTS